MKKEGNSRQGTRFSRYLSECFYLKDSIFKHMWPLPKFNT